MAIIPDVEVNLNLEVGLSEQEAQVMALLVEAHNKFIEMERTHPMEAQEWVTSLHHLQDLIGSRVLRRALPKFFV